MRLFSRIDNRGFLSSSLRIARTLRKRAAQIQVLLMDVACFHIFGHGLPPGEDDREAAHRKARDRFGFNAASGEAF